MQGNFFHSNLLAILSLKGWGKKTLNGVQNYEKIDQKTATRKGSKVVEGTKSVEWVKHKNI